MKTEDLDSYVKSEERTRNGYEKPQLKVFGQVGVLTQAGPSFMDEMGSSSADMMRA